VVADIAKLSVGREASYPRELATDHQQYLSGQGESPGRWYGAGATTLGLEGEASPAGFQAMFEGRHPTTGELLGRPMAATPSRPLTWSCGRPGASRSCTASGMRPPAGRCWPPTMPGWPSGGLPGRTPGGPPRPWRTRAGGRPGVLAVGFDHRTSREGDLLVPPHLVIANRIRGPDGRWTAVDGYRHRLAADASTGPPTSASSSGPWGGVDTGGPPTASRTSRCLLQLLVGWSTGWPARTG
jgi:TrwC relaxase